MRKFIMNSTTIDSPTAGQDTLEADWELLVQRFPILRQTQIFASDMRVDANGDEVFDIVMPKAKSNG